MAAETTFDQVMSGVPEARSESTTTRVGSRFQVLHALASDILRNLDLEETLLSVSNAAAAQVGADMVGIMLADDDQVLRMRAISGHRTLRASRFEARAGEGLAGTVFATGLPQSVHDLLSTPLLSHEVREDASSEGARSGVGAPLAIGDRVIGVLMAWSRRAGAFTPLDEEVLASLASLATIAIENARLYQRERMAAQTLAAQNELLQRASSVHAELIALVLSGGGLMDLTETVARHTRGPACVLDSELETLAATPSCSEVLVAQIRSCLQKASPRADGPSPTALMHVPAAGGGVLLREVTAGSGRLGFLCVGLDHAPGDVDRIFVDEAAVVCALELTKQRAVLEARQRDRAAFVWDLLEGHIADEAELVLRARHLGYALPPRIRVLIVGIEGLGDSGRRGATRAQLLEHRGDALVCAIEEIAARSGLSGVLAGRRGSQIAVIVSGVDSVVEAKNTARVIINGLGMTQATLRLTGGLSGCAALRCDLRRSLFEARSALASASPETSPVGVFDELGALRLLLAPGSPTELLAFARKIIGPALDHDRDHAAELIGTLETYLAEDCSLKRTADRLYVHPKTVHYRLGKIRDLTQRDLTRQDDRFEVQLALAILRALAIEHRTKASV